MSKINSEMFLGKTRLSLSIYEIKEKELLSTNWGILWGNKYCI